jgi:hypothetical protein
MTMRRRLPLTHTFVFGDTFGNERSQLERQWDSGANVSTEDLRVALQRYRSFFSRLLSL